ncbi:DUF2169 domain-containing protein [Roseomonas sp. CECT 9278]|uniref:DUF2169 family type VI secretion system accessory protein n=1 Tax=Roseomonas sp. CECT 9278 TaxID=2845823 RepID=UPI001E2D581C|nr:DUF2169 domain-containing protein [Roseomonas sp. CECT 9278]CAH0210140.1 hypothetical protein ROS9278_02145 [Roseomonas sp. CECT 9278]
MRVEKPLALGLMTRPSEFRRRHYLSVAALSFCPMGEAPALLGEVAMWQFLPQVLPPTQPIDIVLPKPTAEFLVTGSAFAPGGVPVRALSVGARLGTVTRRLGVVGDHHIEDGLPTEPAPFTEMPMGWERAYGGPSFGENPLGRGIVEMPLPGIGFRVALPNIVLPAGSVPHGAPHPVNLGAMDIAWPQRARLAGTHDQAWLENDFPGFARDVDFRMAMAAQPEQRFAGFLAGDEDYAFTNMHPDQPELTGRLPGLQPRILVQRRGSDAFEDVPLNLTTVWFFPAQERLVMVHHGRVRTEEEDARDLMALLLGADRLGAPRAVAEFEAAYAARRDPEGGMIASLDEAALVPAEMLRPDPAAEELRRKLAEEGLPQRRARASAQREHERRRAHLIERGIDPDAHGLAPPPPFEPLPSLKDVPVFLAAKAREADEKRAEAEAQSKRDTQAQAPRIAAAGGTPPDLSAKPSGPPRLGPDEGRARLAARIAELEARGLPAEDERRLLDDPTLARQAAESEETARRSYLMGADMQDPAPRRDAAGDAAARARLAACAGKAARVDLCGADLSGMDLAGFDLTEAWLDGADLSGADLTGATLDRAVLAHARLDGTRLVGASLQGANLGRARFEGADLSDANLRDAVLREADLRRGRFHRADLAGASLAGAILEGADISEAHVPRLFVQDASLAGLRAAHADLSGAVMIRATLDGADFTGARLTSAAFIGVTGDGVGFEQAHLDQAVFVQDCVLRGARFAGATCDGANLRGAVLDGAVFDGASLAGTDLSDCSLHGASFDLARGRGARFTAAALHGAHLTRADLAQASLARADIRAANLSDTSLYEADIARVHSDEATRIERVQRTRTRIHPRRTPT